MGLQTSTRDLYTLRGYWSHRFHLHR